MIARHCSALTAAAMKTSTAVTVAGVTVATGALAYAVYFDYKRRNDTTFRKKLRESHSAPFGTTFSHIRVMTGKDKKKVEKSTAQLKADDVTASAPTTEQLRTALVALQKEPLPASPQEKEAYFMTQVSLGEQMAAQGKCLLCGRNDDGEAEVLQVPPSPSPPPSPSTGH